VTEGGFRFIYTLYALAEAESRRLWVLMAATKAPVVFHFPKLDSPPGA
jgi:hypothetical protein